MPERVPQSPGENSGQFLILLALERVATCITTGPTLRTPTSTSVDGGESCSAQYFSVPQLLYAAKRRL